MTEQLVNWIALLATLVMLAGAVGVLLLNNYLAAVAAASVVSLGASVIFVLLRAPDVALTEAAVGAGLSSVIMALCLRRLGLWQIGGAPDTGPADPDETGGEGC